MENNTPPPAPLLTLEELRHIQDETTFARREMHELIQINDLDEIWNVPRKYFVPEIGSRIPFQKGDLERMTEGLWRTTYQGDPVRRAARNDILDTMQWLQLEHKKMIQRHYPPYQEDDSSWD